MVTQAPNEGYGLGWNAGPLVDVLRRTESRRVWAGSRQGCDGVRWLAGMGASIVAADPDLRIELAASCLQPREGTDRAAQSATGTRRSALRIGGYREMAKDLTIRVTGTNPDGTINVQMPDGGNPFMSGTQQTGLVLANQPTQPVQNRRIPSADWQHRGDVCLGSRLPESRQSLPRASGSAECPIGGWHGRRRRNQELAARGANAGKRSRAFCKAATSVASSMTWKSRWMTRKQRLRS